MTEVETILEAISNLDKKVSDRLNGLEKLTGLSLLNCKGRDLLTG